MSPAEMSLAKTKRKRPPQADEHIGTKLEKKLHHDRKEVRKAARKAKTFETQKILKKIKDARQKGDDSAVKDIEAQHLALKSLDSDLIAESALSTKIKKDKILSQDPNLRSAMSKPLSALIVPAAPSSVEGKVQSRLLSSKVLAADVSRIIKGLRRLLNPEEWAHDAAEESPDRSQPPKKKRKTRGEEGPVKVPAVEIPLDNGESNANIEDEDDGWESGTVSDGGHSVQGNSRLVSMSNNGSDDDDDEDNSASERGVGPSVPIARPLPDVKRNLKASTVQSSFLPSLSVGFIRGDSDTDFSDSEAQAADEVKKNRRGQRARRAIWEKKFGRHANHVMKQKDISRAPIRSHSVSGAAAIRQDQRGYRRGNWGHSDGAPFPGGKSRIPNMIRNDFSAPRKSGTHTEERSLHPSWEAKKKQQNVAIVPAQGTRIVFD